jgi:hypothetical protein
MPPKARDLARLTAEGFKVEALRKQRPDLARAYDLYVECRLVQIIGLEIPKNKKTSLHITPYTSGYGSLPEPGGMLDQPYRMMELWSHFLAGDRLAFSKSLK